MADSTTIAGHLAEPARRNLPTRLQATGIHLAVSLAIFAVALYLILARWYPGFHFAVDGGWQGVRIMIAVDLVLGPLLTLVIFNPRKTQRAIAFDLSCIGATQLAALVWGFYAIHSQRPVSVNYLSGEFHSITAEPFRIEGYPVSMLRDLSDRHPALVYVRKAENDDEKMRRTMMLLVSGLAEHEDPFFFEPLREHWAAVEPAALNVDHAARSDKALRGAVERFLEERGGAAADYRFFPYTGRYGACTVAFSAGGDLLEALACRGF